MHFLSGVVEDARGLILTLTHRVWTSHSGYVCVKVSYVLRRTHTGMQTKEAWGGGECPRIHLARMPCMYSTSQESATVFKSIVSMKLGVELCMYHPSCVSRPTVLFHLL